MLGQLVNAARAGESRALVVRGEPGVGKTALLDYLAEHTSGCRVARAVGVESEMELAYAGVHQLLTPMLDRLQRLPGPQRQALRGASAWSGAGRGPVPGRAGGLEPAVRRGRGTPLVAWSRTRSGWIAPRPRSWRRRPAAGRGIGRVGVRARVPGGEWAGCRSWGSRGSAGGRCPRAAGRDLPGRLDARVRDRIVAETRGNPLALLELPGA